jgi:hypothetical protein
MEEAQLFSILPCKKCGNSFGRLIMYGYYNNPSLTTYRISCPKCGYCTKEKRTQHDA